MSIRKRTPKKEKPKPRERLKHPKQTEFGDLVPETWVAKSLFKRFLFLALSLLLLVMGLIGWLVPIVTGVPFFVASLVAVAMASHRGCRAINEIDRRLPLSLRRGLRRCQHASQALRSSLRKRWDRLKQRIVGRA